MTEPSETSPQGPQATPQPPTAPPYPYPYPNPYQAGPYPGGYPPPPPQPYAGYAPPPTGPRNGLGVAALVIAIVALVSSFSVAGGIILGIVAVVIGFAARGRVKRGEADNGGVALAGIILGFVAIIVGLAFIAVYVFAFNQVGGGDYIDCLQKAGQDQNQVQKCADQFRQSVENRFSVTLTPTP
ncbi:DUF4190 domain-containing protein [Candidatus Mycolicibacterium alkanivorans]|uniref:DUF4190 domain-containing protein n=1 Tax=Candidatus Mycolicibacterium alkanivorans TaxID=2954114 RepID=A0ABS9YXL0_9MYCO|nr:DUF4190 domain-containing protein [Candidatus Mycolicibacterium alkanivorans]MCI4675985.1 DUF4190 domain-containing protein [Candidatus Mycolicibacterium alkanivorans]